MGVGVSDEDELWCPRRAEGPQWPGPDVWRDHSGMAGASEAARPTCSFCGSLEPGRFLELVEAGWIVGPTDKSYKAYLRRPLTAEELAERKQQWLASVVVRAVRSVEEASGKSPAEVEQVLERRWESDQAYCSSHCEAKIYFQHLSPEQRKRFIELHNAGRMAIGNPGYFYTKPYFCRYLGAGHDG